MMAELLKRRASSRGSSGSWRGSSSGSYGEPYDDPYGSSLGTSHHGFVPGTSHATVLTYVQDGGIGAFAGWVVYIAVFGLLVISAVLQGAILRKVIYLLPALVAALHLVAIILFALGYIGVLFSCLGDEVMVMLLLTLNVLWHEIVLRPKSSFKARRGWLIAGIILLFINTVLVVITPAGVFINMLSCFVGLVCVLVGMGKAKEPRTVLAKDTGSDKWAKIKGLGKLLAATWFVMLLKTTYEVVSTFILVAEQAIVVRYPVGDLLADVALILVNIPSFVASIDPNDYDIEENTKRNDIENPFE